MMRNELIESISYCVTQDPYTLVNNIKYHKAHEKYWKPLFENLKFEKNIHKLKKSEKST